MTHRLRTVVIAVTCAVTGLSAGSAQTTPGPAHDISGIYVRMDNVGGGSWDGLNAAQPKPELISPNPPAGQGQAGGGRGAGPGGPAAAPAGPRAAGVPVQIATGPVRCAASTNFPGMLTRSVGFSVVQGRTQTLFLAEQPNARVIYTDGRPAPKPGDVPMGGMGYSVGRWEGDEFVIETVGLPGGVPGGGRLGPGTKLTERYRLIDNNTVLKGTYTWDDPSIYVKPYTYDYVFTKLPADEYSREEWCDSSDPAMGQSITPPAQVR